MNTEPQIDQNAMAENIEQTVKRTAMRKVRKLVDKLEDEETSKRRLEKRALVNGGVALFAVAGWFAYAMVAGDGKFERGQTFQLPNKVAVPNKN